MFWTKGLLKELQNVQLQIDQVKSKLEKFDKEYGIPIWYPDQQILIGQLRDIISGKEPDWNITMEDFQLEKIQHFAEYLIASIDSNKKREEITEELEWLEGQERSLKRDLKIR